MEQNLTYLQPRHALKTVSATFRKHWPEYLIEAFLLGMFMISAAAFTVLFEYPASPGFQAIPDPFIRRALVGLTMGLTAVWLIFCGWGKRSGAHMNPSVTLAFLSLGKIAPIDAAFYVIFQFIGGIAGVGICTLLAPSWLAAPSVQYVVTVPGPQGVWVAFIAEFVISFIMMATVLLVSNTKSLARWTGLFAGALVALFIAFEAPLSGMSLNPARTFGSALIGWLWTSLWIYFTAPVLAMQLAAWLYKVTGRAVYCAKMHHHNDRRCIFHCAFDGLQEAETNRKQL